jgi:asparagine synthase (glutamine-hydrolysing)
MCGICGIARRDPGFTIDSEALDRMTEVVRYRGPDSRGVHIGPGIGLGVRRLAINDLETGDQPISNEDGTVTLVCNGEIYNFRELRQQLRARGHRFRTQSDVEVIVHLYEDEGVDCLHRLRGMFAFALWDARRRRLMLARDRLGIKPLAYALTEDGCYFGSELKSILAAARVDRCMDVQALRDVFTFGFVVGPKTMFAEIRRLPPGHVLLYEEGAASLRQYWDVPFPAADEGLDEGRTLDDWAEEFLAKLQETVRLHLRSDVPVGAWLSPGIDSSTTVSLMSRLGSPPAQTYTLAFEDPAYDEVRRSPTLDQYPGYQLPNHRTVCTAADFELFPKVLWHCEDPMAGNLAIARWLLAEPASGKLKVVLAGEGADELLGGYTWYRHNWYSSMAAGVPMSVRRLLLVGGPHTRRWSWLRRLLLGPDAIGRERYSRLLGSQGDDHWTAIFSDDVTAELSKAGPPSELPHPPGFDSWHSFRQLQYYEMKIRLPDWIMHMLDRCSMAHSLEVRVPFLDHELVELCAGMPVSLKMRGLREKHILREAMRGLLPEQIRRRPKVGLRAPRGPWLMGKLPEFASEALSERSLQATGYFRAQVVSDLLQQLRAGVERNEHPLLAVLGVQLWDQLFRRAEW